MRWNLLFHTNNAMVIVPSDSSRRRIIMSKYIRGNQKHLTLKDRVHIENELAKGTFYNSKNFCIHRYHCKKTYASAFAM